MSEQRAVILASGGMDSATAAAVAQDAGYELYMLHTSYGQQTESKEYECAQAQAEAFDAADFLHLTTDHLSKIGASSLTDDEMDVEEPEGSDANRGDWFWRGEGDPAEEPDEGWLDAEPDVAVGADEDDADGEGEDGEAEDGEGEDGEAEDGEGEDGEAEDGEAEDGEGEGEDGEGDADGEGTATDASAANDDSEPIPGVPRSNRDRPVGIPVAGGGAGATPAAEATEAESPGSGTDSAAVRPESESESARTETDSDASGPHGGGADEMTMALTYDAVQRLAAPRQAVFDARSWTDWIGIVGDVPAYQITKFQRDHGIDADFFSGAGQEPAERLADVDEHSMFFAERMVLVGVGGEEGIADRAGWEFVPLETAAEKADWDLADPA